MGDKPITATDAATADMITSLQRSVQEILLSMPRQIPIENATHNLPCDNDPEATADNNHIDSSENTSPLQGPQASEHHSQDSDNGHTIDTQRPEATSNATKRLNDPQDESAAKDMTLMQTMIHASQGDVHAQVALGDRYKDGQEVHQDHLAAFDWYLKAAEQGHPRAQYNIGLLYEEEDNEEGNEEDNEEDNEEEDDDEDDDDERGDDVVLQDNTRAFEWFHKSAIQGYADSQAKIAQAYTNGAGVPKDNIKAMEWLVKAAENGHAGMQCSMGAAYEKGHGVPQSDSRSFEWYLKSAEQGLAKAQERVAAALETGRGVPKDGAKAVEWYTKAADQGHPVDQFALGRVHELGLCGLLEDRSKAVNLYIKAAVQGHTEAQSMLRKIYFDRKLNCLDLQAKSNIKKWFIEAADRGVVHAQCCMADMYAFGRGVEKDYFMAFEWYLKAAEQGDEVAQGLVAYMYDIGRGVAKSRENSFEWYLRLATSGNALAACEIRKMLKQ